MRETGLSGVIVAERCGLSTAMPHSLPRQKHVTTEIKCGEPEITR
uniref:Uncharacterized protein n=1 Tax=Agrobacterium tumefaciens TaxID=358 RepID=A0A2P0QK29_AGRTU|nr:hypothetical protein AgrTiChry5_223 [Agrobacterium tumefaciens]